MSRQKRTFAIDFDGVLHKYDGWRDGKVNGPIDGAREGIQELLDAGHEVVVFSTRDADLIRAWLERYEFPALEVTSEKRPFYVILDDRAITFTGSWHGVAKKVLAFEPYWIQARKQQPPRARGDDAAMVFSAGDLVRFKGDGGAGFGDFVVMLSLTGKIYADAMGCQGAVVQLGRLDGEPPGSPHPMCWAVAEDLELIS